MLAAGVAVGGTQPGDQPAALPIASSATAIAPQMATASPAGNATASRPTAIPPPASRPPTLTGPAALTTGDSGATVRLRRGHG